MSPSSILPDTAKLLAKKERPFYSLAWMRFVQKSSNLLDLKILFYSGTMLKTALFSTAINRKITLYVKLDELNLNQLN